MLCLNFNRIHEAGKIVIDRADFKPVILIDNHDTFCLQTVAPRFWQDDPPLGINWFNLHFCHFSPDILRTSRLLIFSSNRNESYTAHLHDLCAGGRQGRDFFKIYTHMHKNLKNAVCWLKTPSIMIAEHIVYSTALAIIVGMIFYHYTGRDSSWIIILCAWIPDIDLIANRVLTSFGFTLLFEGHRISHGVFHNIAIMVLFGVLAAFLLHPFGIRFFDAFFFAVVGFGAHLFEDALVYKVGYPYLWPFSSEELGIGLLPNVLSEENYFRDFFGIANTEVLLIGIACLLVAILIRTWREGPSWVRWYMPESMYKKWFRPLQE